MSVGTSVTSVVFSAHVRLFIDSVCNLDACLVWTPRYIISSGAGSRPWWWFDLKESWKSFVVDQKAKTRSWGFLLSEICFTYRRCSKWNKWNPAANFIFLLLLNVLKFDEWGSEMFPSTRDDRSPAAAVTHCFVEHFHAFPSESLSWCCYSSTFPDQSL